MRKPKPADLARSATAATKLLKALANRNRLLILCQLGDRELRVQRLSQLIGLSPSALSQHLANLKRLGVVSARREAKAVFYSVPPGPAGLLMKALMQIYCTPARAAPVLRKRSLRRPAPGA